jgi:diamine N-acetyltransferase
MKMVSYKTISISQLNEIKPLWEGLNQVHWDDSVYFRNHYANFTFEKRSARWKTLTDENILIEVAETDEKKLIGYCISTINDANEGEIDSLYVESEFRGPQIGRELMLKSLAWLNSNKCKPIRLAVSFGHENVIGFYEKLGFFPRMTILEYKPTNKLNEDN